MPINCLFYGLFCVALSWLGALQLLIRHGLPGSPPQRSLHELTVYMHKSKKTFSFR